MVLLSVSGAVLTGCTSNAPAASSFGYPSQAGGGGTLNVDERTARPSPPATPDGVTYVALGDSYTIGTSVEAEDRWPNQLARALRPGINLELTANLGVNGYTTTDLIAEELPQLDSLDPEFVTLLIGVNDVVQRATLETYWANITSILDHLLARLPANRILVVSMPDYTLTPEGATYGDPERQSGRIRRFNAILREESERRGLAFVDISPVSDRTPADATLVASDGLHPSSKQYAGWVELIAPQARALMRREPGH